MYKVFFNNNRLYISKNYPKNISIDIEYNYINKLQLNTFLFRELKKSQDKNILILTNEKKMVWKTFKSFFTIKKAAGGLTINKKGQLLFIKRRGLWDLPKGHIEKNERKKTAALREVNEECGINDLTITKKIVTTYHTYYIKKKPILKPTYWYLMAHNKNEKPRPEAEEDIEQAIWVEKEEISKLLENAFPSISEVITKANY